MKSQAVLDLLQKYESRNVTFVDPEGGWPIVWKRARNSKIWDADGKEYVDLTAAFGVAACGHANTAVVRAVQKQAGELLHAMGDVHPHEHKARLARELSRLTFERWPVPSSESPAQRAPSPRVAKTIFGNSGFEAVEAALKTARLATGRSGIAALSGAYHGLGYGALNATHRGLFRSPFQEQLAQFGRFVPFPRERQELAPMLEALDRAHRESPLGAILIEPVQGRGGIRIPASQCLPALRKWCDEHGALLVADEIFTGFGRTGKWFACEHSGVVPDLLCLGKALTGGFPLSACLGPSELMDAAWPVSQGEAIHTSTFLGHPVGCAMALAQIKEIRERGLVERSESLGAKLLKRLRELVPPPGCLMAARGLGLMIGLELGNADGAPASETAFRVVRQMLRDGVVVLPEGEHGEVISFTPPLTIPEADLARSVEKLQTALVDAV